MPRSIPDPLVQDALVEVIVERLEAALEIGIAADGNDLARQRQRWLSLLGAGDDIAALARSLEILTRPR